MNVQSDTTQQPSIARPSVVFQCSTVNQQVKEQFTQMKTMLSSLLRPRQETTRTAFCNYLASEVEALKDRDVKIFRSKALKLFKWDPEQGRGKDPPAPGAYTF